MKLLKQFISTGLWLIVFLATSLFLLFTFLLALIRGRQEQYFTQKPIFDPGEKKA